MNSHFRSDRDADKAKAVKLRGCVTSTTLLRFEKADVDGPVDSFKY